MPSSHEVVRGDTLFRIAGKTRPPGVTLHQMVLALYRANPEAFLDGNINQLVLGRTLTVPSRDAILAVDAVRAAAELKALVARSVAAPPLAPVQAQPAAPTAKEPAATKPRLERPAKPSTGLTPEQVAERYQHALQAERSGDIGGAMVAYLAAAEAGHGLAQKRLGDIYNTGNEIVRRDYETALRWYQKAREQGVDIPKPITHTPIRPN
jgi:pilus assembly protein FimV